MHQGPEVTNKNNPLMKRMKWIVHTNVASKSTIELWNLSSEIEDELWTNYGDKDDVEGDDEREDNDGNIREEAPNDPNICIRQPLGLDSNILCRLGHLYSTPMADE